MKTESIKTIGFFYRADNNAAPGWESKIKTWVQKRHPAVKLVARNPDALIVLGGDGTILEAVRAYEKTSAGRRTIIFGLNLGLVGFLASAREPDRFFPALDKLLSGEYAVVERMMLNAAVYRGGKKVFTSNSLNEFSIQSILGMVELAVHIERHPVQLIRGSGVLVATATGSTAYNLSAHGPIVMPDIKCMVVTEIMDHNMPTPSIVVKYTRRIELVVKSFRKRGLFLVKKNKKDVDVVLAGDGENIFPLAERDRVVVTASPRLARFAEVERNYFFKSLEEKFSFR